MWKYVLTSKSVDACIKTYNEMAEKVFNIDNVLKGVIPTDDDQCRFNFQDLEDAIKSLVKQTLGDEDVTMASACDMASIEPGNNLKARRTFVVATRGLDANSPPVLLRSYGHEASSCRIWEAARATSAAPTFFKHICIHDPVDGTNEYFVDGGVAHNNPSELALTEAKIVWKNVRKFCVVSIGTGRQGIVKFIELKGSDIATSVLEKDKSPEKSNTVSRLFFRNPISTPLQKMLRAPRGVKALLKIVNACVDMCNNSERVHQRLCSEATAADINSQFPYYRFDVDRGMDKISLEEWKKKDDMIAFTRSYMAQAERKRMVIQCAKNLWDPSGVERTSTF
jgi:hypothetical protein